MLAAAYSSLHLHFPNRTHGFQGTSTRRFTGIQAFPTHNAGDGQTPAHKSQPTTPPRKMYENESGGVLICIWNIPDKVKRHEFHFLMARVPGVKRWQFIAKGHMCQESAGYAYCECPTMEDADETIWFMRRFRVRGTKLRANLYDPRRVGKPYYPRNVNLQDSYNMRDQYRQPLKSHRVNVNGELTSKNVGSGTEGGKGEGKSVGEYKAPKVWKFRQPTTIEGVKKLLKTKLKLIPDINEVLRTPVPKQAFSGAKMIAEWKRKKKEMEKKAALAEYLKMRKKKVKPVRPPNDKLKLGNLNGRTDENKLM